MRCAAVALLFFAAAAAAQQTSVRTTLHNLSASGPGDIRSTTETEICKFCHIPHHAVAPEPLWGHRLPQAQYDVPSLARNAPSPQPDGSSRLCLSCHDGTVALGDIGGKQPIAMGGTGRFSSGRRGYLGTDLSGSHPISFVVADDRAADAAADIAVKPLAAIRADRQVRLDKNGKMQCTTCHDPHADPYYDPGRVPHFLVKPNTAELCLTCHELR